MSSPYKGLHKRAYWKTGVANQNWEEFSDIWRPKFSIDRNLRIMTAGSCFAQHITRKLRAQKFGVIDTEPAPRRMSPETAHKFGYGLYSARYGNVYTVRQLLQLVKQAFASNSEMPLIHKKQSRFFDALRPSVEPHGFSTEEEVVIHRAHHLKMVRRALKQVDIFIFTLGLTEAWVHLGHTVLPTAPGTIAGSYDPAVHTWRNFSFNEIYADFTEFRKLVHRIRPECKFLLTVSPVPLTATAADQHILPATIHSKSILRAVAGQLIADYDDVDYFPSYELIATPFLGSCFYEDNMREVRSDGVALVMDTFFGCIGCSDYTSKLSVRERARRPSLAAENMICEDVLLEQFA